MTNMLQLSRSVHLSAGGGLLLGQAIEAETLASYRHEFDELWADLRLRPRPESSRRLWPEWCDLQTEAGLMLYSLVRATQPRVVVETGVAMGYSTCVLLSALNRNGAGNLYSTDVTPDVGFILSDTERARWNFWLLDRGRPKVSLKSRLAELDRIDLFLHDSMHTYEWQTFECRLALTKMSSTAVLACDDADDSYGYIDFCHEIGAPPVLLCEGNKVFGATLVP